MDGGTAYRRLKQVNDHLDTLETVFAHFYLEPVCSDGDENVKFGSGQGTKKTVIRPCIDKNSKECSLHYFSSCNVNHTSTTT